MFGKQIIIEQVDRVGSNATFGCSLGDIFRACFVDNEVLGACDSEVMFQLGDSERGIDAGSNSTSTNHAQPQAGVQDLHDHSPHGQHHPFLDVVTV